MTSITVSDALSRSSLVTSQPRDPEMAHAFSEGIAVTAPASKPKHGVGRYMQRFIGNSRRIHASSPDREKSRRRKRKWGGSSCMPDWMREDYTEGERAALAIVVQEVKKRGHCDLRINAIAQLAGIHRTTVQNAFRKARKLNHIVVQERPGVAGQLSMTNIIRIVCGIWKAWLRRVGSGFKRSHPSEMKVEKEARTSSKTEAPMAYEKMSVASFVPDHVRWRHSAMDGGLIDSLSDHRRAVERGSIALMCNQARK